MNKLFLFLFHIAVIAVTVPNFSSCSFFEGEPPNIILISIDTLRHDHLGYAGHAPEGKSPSPCIDAMAGKGTVFTHAVSTSSWTLPGHYALITGLPDELHEMYDDLMPLNPKVKSMAQYLKKQGYVTGGFYSGPYLHDFFKFHRGFDIYESCMSSETMYDVLDFKGDRMSREETDNLVKEKEVASHLEITSKAVVERSAWFARSNKRKPFFLFMHFFDVHNDFIPPAPFNKKYNRGYEGWVNGYGVVRDPRINPDMDPKDLRQLKALYDGEISWVDHNLEWFFEEIQKADPDILENTLVVFTADHGEEFFEHGRMGHRWNVYGESIRIPLFIHGPGLPEGKRIDDPVRIYDIYPTVVDLAGLPAPEGVYGRSLAPLIRGEKMTSEPVVSELTFIPSSQLGIDDVYHKFYAFQLEDLKLVGFEVREWTKENRLDFTGDVKEKRLEVYNVREDPGEEVDLAEKDPKLPEQLLSRYYQELERMKKHYRLIHGKDASQGKGLSAVEMPEHIRKQLEALGYL
ncbi:MAG: sulfatase [Planctomycetota bacterium]